MAPHAENGNDPAGAAPHPEAVHLQSFSVSFEYPVVFTRDVLAPDNPALVNALTRREPERRHRLLAVVDEGVDRAWPGLRGELARYVARHEGRLALAGAPEVVPGGETAKNDPALVARLRSRFHEARLDRQSFVLIVGGGAVLDVAGYAAATVHRGLRVVRLPTTVLAQDDSGVGVKNGVNGCGAKNLVGTFAPPFAVINDARFLETLSPRDKRAGMAEAVKVALIRDPAFFDWLEASAGRLSEFAPPALEELVRRSAELHLRHIATSGDPFETGSARPLDFGHWSAHKLETLSGHALGHGEAVAIGLALDARYSVESGRLAPEAAERVCALLERLGLPLWHDMLELRGEDGRPRVLDGLEEFREHLGGQLTLVLLDGIGRGVEVEDVSEPPIRRALDWLRRRARRA
jgi:3-dehydroquinate synthase